MWLIFAIELSRRGKLRKRRLIRVRSARTLRWRSGLISG